MPTYEYSCQSCNEVIEVFQSMRDEPLKECPKCGQPGVKRLIGRGAGIIFKGSGFYETDYKRSSSAGGNGKSSSGGAASGSSNGPSTSATNSSTGAGSSPGSASAASS
ncbi:MAG: FmdB family transcriptional regulator [Verrucomicrobia bacterium]|nr:MAG: FmdB family transcriptional regulator [Verrucomicrobiota bacterium]